MKAHRTLSVFIVLLFGLLPSTASTQVKLPPLPPEEQQLIIEDAKVFAEILAYYSTLSLDKPADLQACAQEMLKIKPNEKSCRDRWSAWEPKEDAQMLATEMDGKFGGVGLELSAKDGKIIVVSPIDGTPAYRAGFKPDDVIVKVDGIAIANIADVVKRMRGKAGVAVEITVMRGGRELTFNVVREVITIHAISARVIDGPSGLIGYIQIKIFSEVLPGEFRKEMAALHAKGVTRVILDLRNNPGGLMWSALDILYEFSGPNDIRMTMRERNRTTTFDASYIPDGVDADYAPGASRNMKVVVLVNKGSASASEIFAGTMKDWGFPVVGTDTFGKGVGQTILTLSDGSSLRLTTFEFLVGNSKTKINGVGVNPTYKVAGPQPSSSETLREDKQLEKAVELLSK